MSNPSQLTRLLNRRHVLGSMLGGLNAIALIDLLNRETRSSSVVRPQSTGDQVGSEQNIRPLAKRVVLVFCTGALSHVDTFDYKPELFSRHGQPLPGGENLKTFQGGQGNLARPIREFLPRGETGKMTSELLPHLGSLADDFCFLHGMTSRINTHGPGENFMSTGFTLDGFPSLGAWVNYALGSANENLPAFVSIPDPRGNPQAAGNNWGSAFLPAKFQGIPLSAQRPLAALMRPKEVTVAEDLATSHFLKQMNEHHLLQYPEDSEFKARILSYELAARMQNAIPPLLNFETESKQTLRDYGVDQESNPVKAAFARNCILARRLCESGVRFVQLFNGAFAMGEGVGNWDGHKAIGEQYPIHAEIFDQPTAALFRDLKARGLLNDTLFVICTEFGRMPTFQAGASGRDHNPSGFTCLMAGAGIRAPFSWGATDDFGWKSVENVTTVYDFHATILRLLGLDHEKLTVYHNGANRRLTDVHGSVIQTIIRE